MTEITSDLTGRPYLALHLHSPPPSPALQRPGLVTRNLERAATARRPPYRSRSLLVTILHCPALPCAALVLPPVLREARGPLCSALLCSGLMRNLSVITPQRPGVAWRGAARPGGGISLGAAVAVVAAAAAATDLDLIAETIGDHRGLHKTFEGGIWGAI